MSTVRRRERLGRMIADRGADALYVGDLVNVRYLTGFTGSNGAVLVFADGSAVFFTDGRYREQAAQELPDLEHVITRRLLDEARKRGRGSLLAETHVLSVDAWRRLGEPESSGRLVEELRETKDEAEISLLRRACAISSLALEQLLAGPLTGRTERELALDLETRMVELGAQDKAFDTILAAGENSAIPHHRPTDRVVKHGDLLKIDFGALVEGYHADCTRTVVLGRAADWQREIYTAVRDAQAAGLERLRAGVPVADSYRAATESLDAAGWLSAFTTGLGHGVGLQIHEDPFLGAAHPGRLTRRTVLTMEPGIYLPGRGGVRIEDTVVVTDAAPEVLTTTPKDLMEIA
ncbi:peptidase M24 family protein [Aeromicrobium sp. PE09-221]|uniref:M24 family metallopeptidase n=1 Tax=Aeromicrobium sp. PE09-221 TaxID=1898043 RepID=UPI000B3EDE2B|nr:Xaa-Pro peptidase family protein [Aeromicrobium sp. PE09-221]OUZ09740.1 peptidase M24 family protein [Aeromicrobium sp. PE09-221]